MVEVKPVNGSTRHRFRDVLKHFLPEPIRRVQHPSRGKEELNSQLPWSRQCHLHMQKEVHSFGCTQPWTCSLCSEKSIFCIMFKGSSEIAPVKEKLQCGQYFPFWRRIRNRFQIIRKKQYLSLVEFEKMIQ